VNETSNRRIQQVEDGREALVETVQGDDPFDAAPLNDLASNLLIQILLEAKKKGGDAEVEKMIEQFKGVDMNALITTSMASTIETEIGMSPAARAKCTALCLSGQSLGIIKTRMNHGRYRLRTVWWEGGGGHEPVVCPRVHNISPEAFHERFVSKNLPCIITGGFDAETFPPLRDFNDMAYLKKRAGHRVLPARAHFRDEGGRRLFYWDKDNEVSLSEYIDNVEAPGDCPMYLNKTPLRKWLPEMADDVAAAPGSPGNKYKSAVGGITDAGVYMYFGGGKNTTNTHYDPAENFMLVVSGVKRLVMFPPSEVEYVYPAHHPSYTYSGIPPMTKPSDGFKPQKYPLFKDARSVEIEVRAGEMLYLPIFWYHGVTGEGRNMILNWWFNMREDKLEPLEPGVTKAPHRLPSPDYA